MKSPFLSEWERATENLAQYFSARYFGNGAEMYWVADEIGGVLSIADYFFNTGDMVDYIRHSYTKEQMFEHYDYALAEATEGRSPINIKNWKKLSPKEQK